jgi:oxalate decarboxylase/phosphoglucose isomerase-like protein (cupin superfamily)
MSDDRATKVNLHEQHDRDLEVERHDVFDVMQLTRDTPLESLVAADLVAVETGQTSQMHRHNNAETVLFFTAGSGEVILTADNIAVPVRQGDRLRIPKGMFHAVRTTTDRVEFISIQSPPILDVGAGTKDLEPITP